MKKMLIYLLTFFISLVYVICSHDNLCNVYAVSNKTSYEALEWVKNKENQKVGSGQCVALIYEYYKFLGYTSPGENGEDYATNKVPNGFGWPEKNGIRSPGDILIYTGSKWGHVAIYESENVSWHQNWKGL